MIYTWHKSFQVYMGNKGKTPKKSVFERVDSQKGPCIFQIYKKVSFNYPHPEELLNKCSELVSKCWHVNKYFLNNYKAKD